MFPKGEKREDVDSKQGHGTLGKVQEQGWANYGPLAKSSLTF